jgi:hypothetical protein
MMPIALSLSVLLLGGSAAGIDRMKGVDVALGTADDPLMKRPICGKRRPQPIELAYPEAGETETVLPSQRIRVPGSKLTFRFPKDLELDSEEQMAEDAIFSKVSVYMAESGNCVAIVTVSEGNRSELNANSLLTACSAGMLEGFRDQGFQLRDLEQGREVIDGKQAVRMSMRAYDDDIELNIRIRLIAAGDQLAVTTILSIPDSREAESVAIEAFDSIRYWQDR